MLQLMLQYNPAENKNCAHEGAQKSASSYCAFAHSCYTISSRKA